MMDNTKVSAEAARVDIEDHVIVVDGPGGAIMSLTPDAAAETAARLSNAVKKAAGEGAKRSPGDQLR
jgi:hypothetical protein